MRSVRTAVAALVVLASLLAALHPSPVRAADELTVAAASSLQDALGPIVSAFEAENPEKVIVTYAGSGLLMAQIEGGAPIDVLLTARVEMFGEPRWAARFAEKRRFATNRLVLIVPASSEAPPAVLADLTRRRFGRIGIGNPGYVPAGTYARAALERAGLFAMLQRRFVFGENVRQVLAYAERGEVDAAFVYRTDATGRDGLRIAFEVPLPEGHAITYGAGVVAGGPHQAAARKFVAFLMGRRAGEIFAARGFGPASGD